VGNGKVRFAFTLPHRDDGTQPRTCGGWRIWCHNEDTYISATSLNNTWKASLHGDAAWRVAVTTENMRGPKPVLPAGTRDRAPWKFTPTPFVDGRRLAFVVAVTHSALLPAKLDRKELQIDAATDPGMITMARIWMTEPGVDFDPSTLVAGPLPLQSGRRVWVDSATETFDAPAPDPRYAHLPIESTMTLVKDPKDGQARAPGMLTIGISLFYGP
jgi:hypothetical protein